MNHTTLPLLPDVLDQARCPKCHMVKSVAEFPPGQLNWCRDCRSDYNRQYRIQKRATYTRQHIGEKSCSRCGRTYPVADYYSDRFLRDGLTTDCRYCRLNLRLRRKTGATRDWKAYKWALQMGNCPICNPPQGPFAFTPLDDLVVDHHEPDGVKVPVGVICDPHNLGIGQFDHDPATLQRAGDYAERTRA